ncbi:MAG: DUF4160 domain-containing protein [Synergistaceae bacterium]|nr:DUF4160 domain-containing protein [Synergistaceae bacterium]
MSEISNFFDIKITMAFNDDCKHHKPHFHAVYANCDALIGIDGELLEGKLPLKQLKLVWAWTVIHEDELYFAWNNALRKLAIGKIEPLR